MNPIVISEWRENIDQPNIESPDWLSHFRQRGYDEEGPNIVIIDEAQLTYDKTSLWNDYLKAIEPQGRDRVILFASYGSATGDMSVILGTPIVIPEQKRVTLRPIDHKDGITQAGLLFTQEEFEDVIEAKHPNHRFSQDFLEFIFEVTAGHIGAVIDMLEMVESNDVSLPL